MVEGIIYKYTSPSGRSYIGQTTNEAKRRQQWFCPNYHYAGTKIDRARHKYGRTNFHYEVLFKGFYTNKKVAISELNKLEVYYIGMFDSYNNGYNCTIGGDGVAGFTMTKEQRQHMSRINTGKKLSEETKRKIGIASKIRQNLPENKLRMSMQTRGRKNPNAGAAMSEALRREVVQLDLNGNFIREFKSIKEANLYFGKRGNISAVCQGKRETAFGYKWKYKESYGNI